MAITASSLAGVFLAVVMAEAGFCGQDLGAYLTEKDGQKALAHSLSLHEEQEGIAGKTGTVWTIEPSGKWKVARVRYNKDGTERQTPVRNGTLSQEQVTALAKVLTEHDLAGMPEKTGPQSKVNPHRVIIKFGQTKATLEGLPARRNLALADLIRRSAPKNEKAAGGVWERFAQMAQAVESHCRARENP
jgi:hypothetical protein